MRDTQKSADPIPIRCVCNSVIPLLKIHVSNISNNSSWVHTLSAREGVQAVGIGLGAGEVFLFVDLMRLLGTGPASEISLFRPGMLNTCKDSRGNSCCFSQSNCEKRNLEFLGRVVPRSPLLKARFNKKAPNCGNLFLKTM